MRSRTWKPTATDVAVLMVGATFVLFGFLMAVIPRSTPAWSFGSNACLTIGIATALVGILLRVQLQIQANLETQIEDVADTQAQQMAELERRLAALSARINVQATASVTTPSRETTVRSGSAQRHGKQTRDSETQAPAEARMPRSPRRAGGASRSAWDTVALPLGEVLIFVVSVMAVWLLLAGFAVASLQIVGVREADRLVIAVWLASFVTAVAAGWWSWSTLKLRLWAAAGVAVLAFGALVALGYAV